MRRIPVQRVCDHGASTLYLRVLRVGWQAARSERKIVFSGAARSHVRCHKSASQFSLWHDVMHE
jgi:hypothetical protein